MQKVLTIAGSDSSGGAGIQADLKTITIHKLYGMSVITALTAQNTTGVLSVYDISSDFVGEQMDSVFTDIKPDAIKIGMLSNPSIIETVYEKLIEYNAFNIVLDPVMVATSGDRLLTDNSIDTLKKTLFNIATIITPNIFEAQILASMNINSEDDMLKATIKISKEFNGSILIKGGHLGDTAKDLLYHNGEFIWFNAKRIDNPNTHGTGCTLSSAICCNLALQKSVEQSVKDAKKYVFGAISDKLNIGRGRGPLNHMYKI